MVRDVCKHIAVILLEKDNYTVGGTRSFFSRYFGRWCQMIMLS